MNAAFVVDCSMTMAWCFADDATPATIALEDRLLVESALVPWHWHLEVTNVLAMAERKSRISLGDVETFLNHLTSLAIECDPPSAAIIFHDVLTLSRAQKLTVYDAAYLELALRTKLPLATLDRELRVAASRLGVVLLGIDEAPTAPASDT